MTDGTSYGELRPVISVCFLTEPLFRDVEFGHLRFSLYDAAHSLACGDQIQLHLVQLSKYDLSAEDLADTDAFSRWVYFLTKSQNYEADQLRELLRDEPFAKATRILEMIAKSPELRLLYDDRAKEAKDRYSEIKDAEKRGEARGEAKGELRGQIQMLQRFLKVPASSLEDLATMPMEELKSLLADLERRFKERG